MCFPPFFFQLLALYAGIHSVGLHAVYRVIHVKMEDNMVLVGEREEVYTRLLLII
jgi:hypothetical protein